MARYANRARRILVAYGGLPDLTFIDKPCRVQGIPWTDLKVAPRLNTNENRAFLSEEPPKGTVRVVWMVANEPEDHRVLLRGVDFAPMLAAWVESERSKRV